MKKIREFLLWFTNITTGTLLICAIQFYLQGGGTMSGNILGHILLTGMLTAAATTLLLPSEECGKGRFILSIVVHFIVLCVIMVYFGSRFGWISLSLEGVLGMIFCVAFVYIFTVSVTVIGHKKEVEQFNRALNEKYNHEDP